METENSHDEEFSRGIELFNTKEFFECHDVWEELWHDERGEARRFLQGMIQAAVGCYHLSNGNTTGAISQYTKSLEKLAEYPSDLLRNRSGEVARRSYKLPRRRPGNAR